jgi:RimJ/RimL family protein N-acetyltransferase
MKKLQVIKLDDKYISKNRNIIFSVKELLSLCVYSPTQVKLSDIIDRYFASSSCELLLLLLGKVLIGIIGVRVMREKVIIKHTAISPYYQKQGLGSKSVKLLIQRYSVPTIEAETDSDSVKFYESNGFKIQEIAESPYPIKRYLCCWKI